MKREIITTADGSTSIRLPDWDENYHSHYGAVQEARHVFLKNGLDLFQGRPVSVLEIGLGTGLNAFLTFLEAEKHQQKIQYTGVEAYPVSAEEAKLMNYVAELNAQNYQEIFENMHASDWETEVVLSPYFSLAKQKRFFHEIDAVEAFDLIYFDAFGFRVQPELWSAEIFAIMHKALRSGGVLVTYAARSVIKRNMQASGFTVEKMAGPPGKREMFRAFKS